MQQVSVKQEVIGGRGDDVRSIRDDLLEQLQAVTDGTVAIDFSGVRILDFSAADEIVTILLRRVRSGELGNRRFVLTGLNDDVRENITAVLKLRRLQCLERSASAVNLLGSIGRELMETLDYINERGTATSSDLTRDLSGQIGVNTASNRLKTLAEAGLITEDPATKGGRGSRRTYNSLLRNNHGEDL